MEHSSNKSKALSAIAEAIGKLNQPEKAAAVLEKAIASVNQIEYFYSQAEALSAIAEVYSKLNQPETAADLLEEVNTELDLRLNPKFVRLLSKV